MEAKYTHYHDPKFSILQSAVNEHINRAKEDAARKGLNYHHPHIRLLNQTLDEAAPLDGAAPGPHHGWQRVTDFVGHLFGGKDKTEPATEKSTSDYACAFRILEQYVDAKLRGDHEKEARKLEELKYSDCDPEWVQSMTHWFACYVEKMQQPVYRVYDHLDDFAYALPRSGGGALKVGLIGDWGTGEEMSELILEQLFQDRVDVIIHLGDIYYSGTEAEYKHHFTGLVEKLRARHGLPIPVYNLPGNHDYYSGGGAFYDSLKDLNAGLAGVPQQEASYFTLSNGAWHLQGMDTGYYDNNVLHVNEDYTHLTDTEVTWHRHHLDRAVAAKKKVILLSHHQLFSRYAAIGGKAHNDKLLGYFGPYLNKGQVAAWFWGHEHLLEIYEPYLGLDKGRCIGNGAVPIFWNAGKPYLETATYKGQPLTGLPEELIATADIPNNGDVYDRGYAILELHDEGTGTARYYVLNDDGKPTAPQLVFEEKL